MMDRFRAALLVLMLMTAFMVPALVPTARAALDVPIWHPGDYWVYEMTGDLNPQPLMNGTVRYDVVGTESKTVGRTTYTAYHAEITYNVSYMGYPMEMLGDAWFRASDLSLLNVTFSYTIMTFSFYMTMTFDPPIEYRWPLTPGATWTATCMLNQTIEMTGMPPQNTTGFISETLRVDPEVSRTVAAGTFTTLPLVETSVGGDYLTSYWSGVVGNWAEQTSYAYNGTETGGMELVSYHYAGPGGDGNILGLPAIAWVLILVPVLFIVIAAVLLLRRRRHEVPPAMPPAQPPLVPPTQPGGPNPPSP